MSKYFVSAPKQDGLNLFGLVLERSQGSELNSNHLLFSKLKIHYRIKIF